MLAIVRTDEQEWDPLAVAKALAEVTGHHATDLTQQFARSPGILFESLARSKAEQCLDVLESLEVSATCIPQNQIVEVPAIELLEACKLDSDGFTAEGSHVTWDSVRWIDMVYIGTSKKGSLMESSGDGRDRFGGLTSGASHRDEYGSHGDQFDEECPASPVLRRKLETKWTPHLDVVSESMKCVYRFDFNRFNFRSTGQTVHPGKQQNILSLCIGIVTQAKKAECGPGVRWIREGGLPQRQRVHGSEFYANQLRWRLTLVNHRVGSEVARQPPSESPAEQSRQLMELVRICRAILEDGKISLEEIRELIGWLRQNRNSDLPQIQSLTSVLNDVIADRKVTREELQQLRDAMLNIIGDDDEA